MLLDEIVELKMNELENEVDSKEDMTGEIEEFVKSWEKEFDFVN
jgi:hypothetical protein